MASTMMMCDQAIMDQESAYLQTLGEVKTFAVQGDQLTLSGEDGGTSINRFQGPIPGAVGYRLGGDLFQ